VRVQDTLKKSGWFSRTEWYGRGCFPEPPPDSLATVVEYHDALHDRYFYTADTGEQAAIDAGAMGNWTRTGESFRVVAHPGCPTVNDDQHPVYRFTGVPDRGPPSHFFTASEKECAVVRDRPQWGWMFEGVPFWAALPNEGQCGVRTALRRLYNDGRGGAPNHRFTTREAIADEMRAKGWVDEGVVMCVQP
jgi:hypothetical protein